MKSTITNAAEITILEPIDNNYKTGGGDISVGGALVVARKGRPFVPMKVYGGDASLERWFGKPLPKKAAFMEGLRQVSDAAEDCSYVQTVRIVNQLRYRFPAVSFLIPEELDYPDFDAETPYESGDIVRYQNKLYACKSAEPTDALPTNAASWDPYTPPASDVAHSVHRWNEKIMVGDAIMTLYVYDGDLSQNRRMAVEKVDEDAERFTLVFYDKDELGEEYELERHVVAVDPDAKDDMGVPAYVETVFESRSDAFRVDWNEDFGWAEAKACLQSLVGQSIPLSGGVEGGEPETSDFLAGVQVFRNESLPLNLLFAAGITDETVIAKMADVADFRHICFFYDVPGVLKAEEAIQWNRSLGITSRHARAYYSPFVATDPWYGGKTAWGVSGAQAAAKARCNATVNYGTANGVHLAPAGPNRAVLTRTGLQQLYPDDHLNRDDFYENRINPIVANVSGRCMCDDDMVQWPKTNYLRFGWINDVLDYIDHRFEEGARQVKFEPDGLTRAGLYNMMSQILTDLVTSGALVAPRDPAVDGTSPWILTIEQLELDLWKVTWEVCITGSARRIVGQPKLIK